MALDKTFGPQQVLPFAGIQLDTFNIFMVILEVTLGCLGEVVLGAVLRAILGSTFGAILAAVLRAVLGDTLLP